MIFDTRNSRYEVDTEEQKIRRVFGQRNPTSRQPREDGDWQPFVDISEIKIGVPVFVTLSSKDNSGYLTSVVVRIGCEDN